MLSAFRERPEQGRRRASLSVARLSRQLGVSVREYREIVEGEAWPADVRERIEAFSGWPRTVRGSTSYVGWLEDVAAAENDSWSVDPVLLTM